MFISLKKGSKKTLYSTLFKMENSRRFSKVDKTTRIGAIVNGIIVTVFILLLTAFYIRLDKEGTIYLNDFPKCLTVTLKTTLVLL